MNRRKFLKRAGVLSAAAILALYSSPSDAADPQLVTVLDTYHSASGNTEKMAQVVADGAKAVSRNERRSKTGR
jgi:flavodoxin